MESINDSIQQRLFGTNMDQNKFWISLNMNSLDSNEFMSRTRQVEQSRMKGVSVEFLENFIQNFGTKTIGMDISSINFEADNSSRNKDEKIFQGLFEMLIDEINKSESQ